MATPGSSGTRAAPAGQQEGSRKRQRPEEVVIRLQAPSQPAFDISIPRSWLKSEYFEAKLERWSADREDDPILLELPTESDPKRGAQALRSRLADAASKEEPWSPTRWWDATDGEELAFLTSLLLFDLLLLESISKEVIAAIEAFQVECFGDYEAVAKKYSDQVSCQSCWGPANLPPLKNVSLDTLGEMLCDCLEDDESCSASRLMADRIIAGRPISEADDDMLLDELMEAFVSYGLGISEQSSTVRRGQPPGLDPLGFEIAPFTPWATRHIRQIIRRRPQATNKAVSAILSAWEEEQFAKVKFMDTKGKVVGQEQVHVGYHDDFFPTVETFWVELVHMLLMEAHRSAHDHSRNGAVLDGIGSLFEVLGFNFRRKLIDTFKLPKGKSKSYSLLSLPIFSVAPPPAQRLVISSLGSYLALRDCFLQGNVATVHPSVRHALLPRWLQLCDADRLFLSTASFPGIEDEKDEV